MYRINKFVLILVILYIFNLQGFGHEHLHEHHHKHHPSNYCEVDIPILNFGEYNPLEIRNLRTSVVLRVKCYLYENESISYTLKLTSGNSSNPLQRYLYSPSSKSKIYYNVYINNCIWGDGNYGTCVIYDRVSGNIKGVVEKYYEIFGVIPYQDNVHVAHDYYDTLQVIIEY